jgi:hypothetical protein
MTEFSSEVAIKAVRKQHGCDACAQLIEVGSPAVRWSGKGDGEFHSVIYHTECRAAEIALNRLHGTFPDEWINICYGREAEDDDWLRSEWPLVASRLGILALQSAEPPAPKT